MKKHYYHITAEIVVRETKERILRDITESYDHPLTRQDISVFKQATQKLFLGKIVDVCIINIYKFEGDPS